MDIRTDDPDIRKIDQSSLEDIFRIYKQCEDFLALGPEPTATKEMVLEDLGHSRDIGGIFCGIYSDGMMVGILDLVPDNWEGEKGCAYLSLLMISLQYRNRGIGSKVVRAAETAITKSKNIRTICAGVQVNNPAAIAFWNKMGYKIDSEPELLPDKTVAVKLKKVVRS